MIKSLHDRGRKVIPLLAGEAKFGTGVAMSRNLSTGEATGVHLTEALRQGVCMAYLDGVSASSVFSRPWVSAVLICKGV